MGWSPPVVETTAGWSPTPGLGVEQTMEPILGEKTSESTVVLLDIHITGYWIIIYICIYVYMYICTYIYIHRISLGYVSNNTWHILIIWITMEIFITNRSFQTQWRSQYIMNNMNQGRTRCYTEFSSLSRTNWGFYMFHHPILDYSVLTSGFECANMIKTWKHGGVV